MSKYKKKAKATRKNNKFVLSMHKNSMYIYSWIVVLLFSSFFTIPLGCVPHSQTQSMLFACSLNRIFPHYCSFSSVSNINSMYIFSIFCSLFLVSSLFFLFYAVVMHTQFTFSWTFKTMEKILCVLVFG